MLIWTLPGHFHENQDFAREISSVRKNENFSRKFELYCFLVKIKIKVRITKELNWDMDLLNHWEYISEQI